MGECRHICRTVYIGLVSEVFLVSVVDLYCWDFDVINCRNLIYIVCVRLNE